MPYAPTSLGPEGSDPYLANGCFHRELAFTTSEFKDWYAEAVVLEHQGTIFEISNGAVRDERLQALYASFHLNK